MQLKNNLAIVISFCLATTCVAQELVKDINTIPGTQVRGYNYYGDRCVPCGSYIYFPGIDVEHGTELWRTDGTAEGTRLVKDTFPGKDNGLVKGADMFCMNNVLYFLGLGLWKSDGTEAGTIQIDGIFTNGAAPYQGKIVYKDDTHLFTTTGEPQSWDLAYTFPDHDNEYTVIEIMTGENLVFVMANRVSTITGNAVAYELWVYDGTTTTMLKSFTVTQGFTNGIVLGDKVIFVADDGTSGREHWVSDGTASGTQILKEINPGPGGVSALPLLKADGKAFLVLQTVDPGIWVTDGTTAGTTKVVDNFEALSMRVFNNRVYMAGSDASGYLIKRMDLDYGNQVNVTPPADWVSTLLDEVDGKLFFAVSDDELGNEVFYVDGASDDNVILKDINPGEAGSYARGAGVIDNTMIFLADDGVHGFEFWKTDGTPENTTLLKDIANSTADPKIGDIHLHNDKLYFMANDVNTDLYPSTLWVSDGTEVGTHRVNDTEYDGNVSALVGDQLIGMVNFPQQLAKTDLTTNVTSLFTEPAGYTGYGGVSPNHSINVGNDTYFYLSASRAVGPPLGGELWTANPVTNEFHLVKDIRADFESSYVYQGVNGAALNDKLIFSAESSDGIEPWVTDGTEVGTFQLKDIQPITGSSPNNFMNVGNYVLFTASSPETGYAVWTTDGTVEGTKLLKQIAGASPQPMGKIGGKVVFPVTNSTQTLDVWTTDGTVEGTSLMKQIPGTTYLYNFMTVGDKVYFVQDSKTLWITDGTEAGTKKTGVELDALSPSTYAVQDDMLFFTHSDGIWYSLGTLETTHSIASGTPDDKIYAVDDHLYFVMNDLQLGRELFKVAIPQLQSQEITIEGLDDLVFGEEYTAIATATSELPVVLTSSDQSVAEFDGHDLIIHKTGTITVTATQNGSEEFKPATRSIEITINKADQQIDFATVAPRRFEDQMYPLAATSTSNLPLTYTALTTTVGKVTISQNILTFVAPGKVTITATQAGNANYNAAEPVVQTFCISPLRPTITQSFANGEITLNSSATTNVWTRNDSELEFTGKSFAPTEDGIYEVAAVVDECQSEFSNPVNFKVTGLEDESDGIEIFPNPVEKELTIRSQPNSQIRILNVAGKEQINEINHAGESVIDVSSFAAGMYFIVIKTEITTHRSKFLKR